MSMPAEHLSTGRDLAELLRGFATAPAIALDGIASDSRRVRPGFLFVACPGIRSHGLDHAAAAIDAGAVAIAFDPQGVTAPEGLAIPAIAVPGLTENLGEIANRFFGRPSEAVRVVGVTGTNGKTTVAWLTAQCLKRCGRDCGYVGTLGAGLSEIGIGESMTTPAALELHGLLADFRDAGAGYAAIEVSSHALAQGRVDGVAFDTVMFTNLTRDHLDYHGNMRQYEEAKARLFLDYSARHRIINLDSEFGARLADRCGPDVITVSTKFDRVANGRPFVFVRSVVAQSEGSRVRIASSWGDAGFLLPMPGDFNVANAVVVLGFLLRQGIALDEACELLSATSAPPGRLERVAAAVGLPAVYIDYAHTPAAIDGALRALKAHCRGKLWCVFGCGGNRDTGKRPQMGRAAERLAHRIVVTSDNPRDEAPAAIIDEIVAGLAQPARATVIEDRAAAIAWAIRAADPDDVVLVAGKGHEHYQVIGDKRLEFSDYAVAQANLAARGEGRS
jgi:UDP-N-acetylmuramoyl-L-alanyl-D-glutamate--2,6-diaminopimelate ligase